MLLQMVTEEMKPIARGYWEKTSGSLPFDLSGLCPTDLNLLLFLLHDPFTAMNLSHQYDYMLSAVTPSESLDLGWSWGPDAAQSAVSATTQSDEA